MPVADSKGLRNALGCYPTGVAVMTTRDADGEHVGVTVNSFVSVSLDPPLVAWCLARTAHSIDPFMNADHFAVNVLAENQRWLSDRFASAESDKFSGVDFDVGNGDVALLRGTVSWFSCEIVARHEGGDHVVLIGHVTDFGTGKRDALLFYRGGYGVPDTE